MKPHLNLSAFSNHIAWYGQYIPVCPLIGTRTAHYRAVPPIGAVSASLPPEIDQISTVTGQFRAELVEGERRGRRKGRTWRSNAALLIPIRQPQVSRCFVGRNFDDRGEKKTTHGLLVEASLGDF
ncbi:hypothetical protein GW17_00049917, partial [Ensete ventricosum]